MTLGALGDSITAAYNASTSGNNPSHSWATGDAGVGSHKVRLERIFPNLEVIPVNHAVAGARADALAGQVSQLLTSAPDYVTLLIGANDLTSWLMAGEYGAALQRFKSDVESAVRRLVAANPRVMILLSAVPDQARVLRLVLPQALVPTLANIYRERWERANQALAAIAAAFPANVRFVAKTSLLKFSPEHLSPLDSYHPSVAGQKLLADVTWEQGFF
jgi:lysophospholipase L1-like esterase